MARAKAAEKSSRAARAGSATSHVVKQISSARDIRGRIVARREPSPGVPLRSLPNVRRGARKGHREMPGKKKEHPEKSLP